MTIAIAVLVAIGIVLPHGLRLERSAPAAAAALWAVSLALRALITIFLALYLALFLPGTPVFAGLTHWCWHTVLPVLTTHLGLDGHRVGDAATILPGLLVMTSLLSVAFGVFRGARVIRRLLARDALGPGPSDSVIVAGPDVILAAAGLKRRRSSSRRAHCWSSTTPSSRPASTMSAATSPGAIASCSCSRSCVAASGASRPDAGAR